MNTTSLTWGSLAQGMLSGKYDEHSTFSENDRRRRDVYTNFHGEKLKHNLHIVGVLRDIANNRQKSCSATAIRFILDYFPQGIPIVGIKSASQLRDGLQSQDWHLSLDEMALLNRVSRADDDSQPKETPWQKAF